MNKKGSLLLRIPMIGKVLKNISNRFLNRQKPFRGSEDYWIQRYKTGRNSGPGSYNRLAEFKAEIINRFVQENNITTVIDFGCGDGNQLRLAQYPSYTGLDVSPKALSMCQELFAHDKSKTFMLMKEYAGEQAELAISLDVIFHLVEDHIFHDYMEKLFSSSLNYVIIYASNFDDFINRTPQLRHRKFSTWVEKNKPIWKLLRYIPNRFPLVNDPYNESFSEFYIYQNSQNITTL